MSDNFTRKKYNKQKRTFTVNDKIAIVKEFLESGLTAKKFAPIYDIRMETLARCCL